MCGFFTTDELDDLLFEASEVARFLLEVEGTTLDIDEEIDIEDHITKVMRSVGEAAKTILQTRVSETQQKSLEVKTSIVPKENEKIHDIQTIKKIKRGRKRKVEPLQTTETSLNRKQSIEDDQPAQQLADENNPTGVSTEVPMNEPERLIEPQKDLEQNKPNEPGSFQQNAGNDSIS